MAWIPDTSPGVAPSPPTSWCPYTTGVYRGDHAGQTDDSKSVRELTIFPARRRSSVTVMGFSGALQSLTRNLPMTFVKQLAIHTIADPSTELCYQLVQIAETSARNRNLFIDLLIQRDNLFVPNSWLNR